MASQIGAVSELCSGAVLLDSRASKRESLKLITKLENSKSPNREMRRPFMRFAIAAVGTIAAIVVAYGAFNWVYPIVCFPSSRILTPEDALAFGKQHIRNDKNFWSGIGVAASDEIDALLTQSCCRVGRGDYFIKDT